MNQIWLMLGLKPEGFRAGLKRASDDVKGFEKDWKNLGKVFSAGGLVYLVTGFFRTLIDHANEAKGSIDENTAAVRRFGESLAAAKDSVLDWGVQLLGFVNRAGEGLGMLGKIIGRSSEGGFWSSLLRGDVAGAWASVGTAISTVRDEESKLAQTSRDLAETEERIAERKKRAALERRKTAEEELRLLNEGYKIDRERATALQRLAEFDRKLRLEKLTDEEKLLALEKERRELASKVAVFDKQAKEGMQLTKEGAEELLGLKTNQADVEAEIVRITESKAKAEVLIGDQISSNIEEWEKFKGIINSVGRGDKELSDAELERKINNLKQGVFDAQVQDQKGGYDWTGHNYNMLGEAQKGYLQSAQAELALREKTRRDASIFGEARAFQQSGLTEQRFKEILNSVTSSDQAKWSNRLLTEINRSFTESNTQSKRIADLLDKGVETVIRGTSGGSGSGGG